MADGKGGSAALMSYGLPAEIADIEAICLACLADDSVISLDEFRRKVRPEIHDACREAVTVYRREQAAIHVLKDTSDQRNTEEVLARAGIWFPRERRKKVAA